MHLIRPLHFKTENQPCTIFDSFLRVKIKYNVILIQMSCLLQSAIVKLFASFIARPPEGVKSYI